ncbi:hypothetical protein BSL78_13717 [Apostichopus japonicus]|uniref:Uncharacterized protein n=1 Tax=Stichopus japonicus TaxID=307972 RepID=A0A2G8KN64_STIJA|nr:hypothetical protein BSL78_13717 [Apostichopus japonicus]
MARIIICCLVICLAVLFSEACPGTSSQISYSRPGLSPVQFEISEQGGSDPKSLYFDIETGVLELRDTPSVPERHGRDVDSQKNSIFKSIDMNGNQYIEICEWVKEGGSAKTSLSFSQTMTLMVTRRSLGKNSKL